jgi:hypothetical protein
MAHAAAEYLLRLKDPIEPLLAIKLDTLRADLTVEKEDRAAAELNARHPGRHLGRA